METILPTDSIEREFSNLTDNRVIELHFTSIRPVRLEGIRLKGVWPIRPLVHSVTGYSANPPKWTAAVRALVAFLVRNRVAALRNEESYSLAGAKHSPAATLDFAITKQPRWLRDLFGCDVKGISNIRSLIKRVNSERKNGGDVLLQLADPRSARSIRVFLGKIEITDVDTLSALADSALANKTYEKGAKVLGGATPHSDNLKLDADYSRIVIESRNYSAAVKKLIARYSGLGTRPLLLECHIDIVVINDEGDAKIVRNYIVANVAKHPLSILSDRLCLENPKSNVKAIAYLQSTGANIPVRFISDTPHKKELELIVDPAIAPGSICAYSVEFSVRQIFRHNAFWFSRISPGCVRQSLSVQLNHARRYQRFHTMVELPNGDICDGVPWVTTRTFENSVRLDWEIQSPTANSIIKTFWGGGEPS